LIDEEKKLSAQRKPVFSSNRVPSDTSIANDTLKGVCAAETIPDTTYVSEPETEVDEGSVPIEEKGFSPVSDEITEGARSKKTDVSSEKAAEKNVSVTKDPVTIKEEKNTENTSTNKDVSAKEPADKQNGKKEEKKSKKDDDTKDRKKNNKKKEREERIQQMKDDTNY
jgi:hypothetical protein